VGLKPQLTCVRQHQVTSNEPSVPYLCLAVMRRGALAGGLALRVVCLSGLSVGLFAIVLLSCEHAQNYIAGVR